MNALTRHKSRALLATVVIGVLGILVTAAGIASLVEPAARQAASHLREMPPPSRVIAAYSAGEPMDARARQVAALSLTVDVAGGAYIGSDGPTVLDVDDLQA